MTTHLLQYDDPEDLARGAREHLLANEAMNNVFFGVMADAAETDRYTGDNLWIAALESGDVIGVAMRTPPYPVALSYGMDESTAAMLVGAAIGSYDEDELSFMLEPRLAVAVEPVVSYHGYGPLEVLEGQGVYQLDEVEHPDDVDGECRVADDDDLETIARWTRAFSEEAANDRTTPEDQLELARRMVADGAMYLWSVDGEPVSMAAARGPTPNGIRVSYVYTPLDRRKNGYASAVVAALSQKMLDSGREMVFLYTDLANPTSNHIYADIGYRRVGDMSIYRTRRG